jgi:hypothetical protein
MGESNTAKGRSVHSGDFILRCLSDIKAFKKLMWFEHSDLLLAQLVALNLMQ